jgi:hypothetical protein
MRLGLFAAAAAFGALMAPEALANPVFPAAVQQLAGMTCTPQCTLCHNTNLGGPGNINTSTIGSTWVMFGLAGSEPTSINGAFAMAQAAMFDTDGDGTPDTVELQMGRDPDKADPNALICTATGGSAVSAPEYGCGGGRIARRGPIDNVAAFASAMVGLIGLAALRRRSVSKRRR